MGAIVIDNGSGVFKAGFAQEDGPRLVYQNVLRPTNGKTENLYRDRIESWLKNPIERGSINDWDAMELLWSNVFENLFSSSTDQPVLLTDKVCNPKDKREKMTEIMFEKFQCPALFIEVQASLALYASGRTTGLVLDSGDGLTSAMPIVEGSPKAEHAILLNVAGSDLTNSFMKMLHEKEITMNFESARYLKTVCSETRNSSTLDGGQGSYTLPDGKIMVLDEERYLCCEAMFNPCLLGEEKEGGREYGIHKMIAMSIANCGIDIRKDLYRSIVLSGGNTLFLGFKERLHDELYETIPTGTSIEIVSPADRKYSVWIGGSVMAGMACFENICITSEEYEEFGHMIVHRKCC